MKKYWIILIMNMLCVLQAYSQKKEYKVLNIGFYNLENLFDTINDPTNDESFTPEGEYHYNTKIYTDKLQKLASVISIIGTDQSPDGLAVWGTAEIEHKHCLEDLMKQPLLLKRQYKVIEYESPDERGIDCAFVYNPNYFTPIGSKVLPVPLPSTNDTTPNTTRDILYVWGNIDGEEMHFFINHWPSRRGGEEASAPLRNLAASICKKETEEIFSKNPDAKIVIMGDLNDDPVSESVKKILAAKSRWDETKSKGFYNPFYDLYKKGIGTLAYRDAWGLFDQIIISKAWENKQKGWFYQAAHVFNRDFMLQKTGNFKGYPLRTFVGTEYMGGYSDHFPTYITFLKQK